MGLIVKRKGGIKTVGEMIQALARFPLDMQLDCGGDESLEVYKVKPQEGEVVEDSRGMICITGEYE